MHARWVINYSNFKSTVDLRDVSKRAPDSWNQLQSMYFRTLNHPHDVKCSPGEILAKTCIVHVIWPYILRKLVEFLVRVRVLAFAFVRHYRSDKRVRVPNRCSGTPRKRVEKVTWQSSVEWFIIIIICRSACDHSAEFLSQCWQARPWLLYILYYYNTLYTSIPKGA